MTPTTIDLFAESQAETALTPAAKAGLPTSITATGTGMSPEWGPYALDIVFAEKKKFRKARLTPDSSAELVRAMWTYALARHEALAAKRSAAGAATSLLGHRGCNDKLDQALRVIDSYCIDVSEIPAAREFGPQFDLRHLAGTSPFPESPAAAAANQAF